MDITGPIPSVVGLPFGCKKEFWDDVWLGWLASQVGFVDTAKGHLATADAALTQGRLNPSLSVLRHNVGVGSGSVESVEATEDEVVSLFLGRDASQGTAGDISENHIERFIEGLAPGHHKDNIKVSRPHVMVMSTGRCGTMSLHKLFRGSNLQSYHTYWFMVSPLVIWEMACRLFSGDHESLEAPAQWAETRAAEWLGEKPMIGLNHTDTIFAPVFAAIHPESKFVYLRRDPEKVFHSFLSKNQYKNGANCFRPCQYGPEDEKSGIRYHIEKTEQFCRAFGRVMGNRWIEISADKLFEQDEIEIYKLLNFTNSDIPIRTAIDHFTTKINEKAHKCRS